MIDVKIQAQVMGEIRHLLLVLSYWPALTECTSLFTGIDMDHAGLGNRDVF